MLFFDHDQTIEPVTPDQIRTSQAFGPGTVSCIHRLTIGVVGASGTGGWVIEQLGRLGAHLVVVDHDRVENKNLNRIVESVLKDAEECRPKAHVFSERIPLFGTNSTVEPYVASVLDRAVADRLAECDVIFGCVDSLEGRDVLNRIATFYTIPYFDVGVLLRADGHGSVETVCGSIHYLLPGGSSLLSRGVYTPEDLAAETLKRTNPDQYESRRKEGYIRGARTDSPAVISVNGFIASAAVNEFLARIHQFRLELNEGQRWQQFDLANSSWTHPPDGGPCPLLAKGAGRGDLIPFLNCTLITDERHV